MPTLLAIRTEVLDRFHAREHWRRGTTTAAGTSTTVVDSGLAFAVPRADVNFIGAWVKMTSGSASGSEGRVTDFDWSTGTFTLAPALSDASGSGSTYEIWRGVHPDTVDQTINRILRNLYVPSFFPLSSHIITADDNDMETSGVSSWSTSFATPLKDTTTAVKNGAQSLKVTSSNANGYVTPSLTFGVNEGQSYYVSAYCWVTNGDSAKLLMRDLTANADIDSATSADNAWMELAFLFDAPTNSTNALPRFISVANGDVIYWDDYLLLDTSQRVFPLPSWIRWPEQVLDLRRFRRGSGGPAADDDYRTNENLSEPLFWTIEDEDIRALEEVRLGTHALAERAYIYALRPLSSLSSDTATTGIDTDVVTEHVLTLLRNPEREDKYLAYLRHLALGKPRLRAPERVLVNGSRS